MSFMLQNISVGYDIKSLIQNFFSENKYPKVLILVDENTALHCYPLIQKYLPTHHLIEIKSGEEQKNLITCEKIWQVMTELETDRKSLLLNLGGGVIGDMGGFCAATFKRGIDFIQIPTTLLSQVDASVGGKLGIDFQGFKNHIGVFELPKAVWINPDFLKTLPVRELLSGYAEIIKHCLIADPDKWLYLIQNLDTSEKIISHRDWQEIILHSIEIKSTIVDKDPRESGLRKILNFGHTIGHAIESYFLNIPDKKLLHGEAIAIGLFCEAYLSYKKNKLPLNELESIISYLSKIYIKINLQNTDISEIIYLTLQDKKNQNNTIQTILLEAIGEPVYDQIINFEEIEAAIQYYQQFITNKIHLQ